jgi:hypothetical protein
MEKLFFFLRRYNKHTHTHIHIFARPSKLGLIRYLETSVTNLGHLTFKKSEVLKRTAATERNLAYSLKLVY